MHNTTHARKYRVTLGITDTRNPGPVMTHVVKVMAYDALDAGVQAGMELTQQGLLTLDSIEQGLKFEIHNVQPDAPPLDDQELLLRVLALEKIICDDKLFGAERGPVLQRLAHFLHEAGH